MYVVTGAAYATKAKNSANKPSKTKPRPNSVCIFKSKKTELRILVLEVFDTNEKAKNLYRKMGFKEAGRIPKGIYKNGEYIDSICMTLEL